MKKGYNDKKKDCQEQNVHYVIDNLVVRINYHEVLSDELCVWYKHTYSVSTERISGLYVVQGLRNNEKQSYVNPTTATFGI